MAKFIVKTMAFVVLVLACVLLTEIAMTDLPNNEYAQKRAVLEADGSGIQTLILGHSQAYHGLNPQYMGDSVFNCASPLQMPYYDYELLKRHISDMPNLKYVIWPLCDFFGGLNPHFAGYFEQDFRNYIICMWDKYFDIPPIDANRYLLSSELLWSHWQGPVFTRLLSNYLEGSGSKVEADFDGWGGLEGHDPEFNPDLEVDTTHVSDHSENVYLTVQRENIEYARKIAQICKDNDIQLLVITLPCHITHNFYTSEADLNAMDSCVNVMRSVDKSVKYYDYSKDERFTDDDFYDGSHLNKIGAKKFSVIIRDLLNSGSL